MKYWIIIILIILIIPIKEIIKQIINYFIRKKSAGFHDENFLEGDYDEEPAWKKYYETNEDYHKESLGGHDDIDDMDDNPFR